MLRVVDVTRLTRYTIQTLLMDQDLSRQQYIFRFMLQRSINLKHILLTQNWFWFSSRNPGNQNSQVSHFRVRILCVVELPRAGLRIYGPDTELTVTPEAAGRHDGGPGLKTSFQMEISDTEAACVRVPDNRHHTARHPVSSSHKVRNADSIV